MLLLLVLLLSLWLVWLLCLLLSLVVVRVVDGRRLYPRCCGAIVVVGSVCCVFVCLYCRRRGRQCVAVVVCSCSCSCSV